MSLVFLAISIFWFLMYLKERRRTKGFNTIIKMFPNIIRSRKAKISFDDIEKVCTQALKNSK